MPVGTPSLPRLRAGITGGSRVVSFDLGDNVVFVASSYLPSEAAGPAVSDTKRIVLSMPSCGTGTREGLISLPVDFSRVTVSIVDMLYLVGEN